jgi:menaquinone-dependent protoporphyrinogen oxidase
MNKRILVTYATRAGSTAEVATAISSALTARGFAVDLVPVKNKPSLDSYEGVVFGSAVRFGAWLSEAVDFARVNRKALQRMPLAVFTVHVLNSGDDKKSEKERLNYLNALRPLVTPAAEGYFSGALDPSRLSMFDRLAVKLVKPPVGDFRDWEKIRAWSETLFTQEAK